MIQPASLDLMCVSNEEKGEGVTIGHGLVCLEKPTRQVEKAGLVLRRRQGNWTWLGGSCPRQWDKLEPEFNGPVP